METGVILDPLFGGAVVNQTDVPTLEVHRAMEGSPDGQRLLAAIERWTAGTQSRTGNLFERDRYVTPNNIFDQMRLAYDAVETDDVVANVAESTEALAFGKVSFYAEDEDEQDVYNQIAADIDLDSRLREMWRELFAVSQFYCAAWWQDRTYKVRGRTRGGNQRRREFSVRAPVGLNLLDPLKVVPVGSLMFNREQLVYVADRGEADQFSDALDRRGSDPIVERLVIGPYKVTDPAERRVFSDLNVGTERLFLLNPRNVFRHTATRPQYRRFSPVRLRSVFPLLDLKRQLREMDRAHLLGGTSFIVLIKKGTDDHPAKPEEILNLQVQVRTVGRTPVLVGDHRLTVEIVTPKLDTTLKPERYNAIDSRITARLYQMFVLGNYAAGAGGDDSVKLVKVVARGMESRRHMLRRTLEQNLWVPMLRTNDAVTTSPKLLFHPKQISLDFDSAFASFLLDLRASNEISRETILSQFDMDQHDEARHLERERESYDDIFMTQQPFSTPNPALPGVDPASPGGKRQAGRTGGGRRNGGGAAPGSGQGQSPRRPRRTSE